VILGEILMKYHPTANGNIEDYLESQGMEVVQPPMLDFFRMNDVVDKEKLRRGYAASPFLVGLMMNINEGVFKAARKRVDEVMRDFKFYERFPETDELAAYTSSFIDPSYSAGEAWLIPAEILHQAHKGANAFVILQPFGCLPNHITGRGMTKTLKKIIPQAQILSLDYDPDTSVANIENRLQMLIIAAKELENSKRKEAV
jgi:predicted nucleotide-binding protein (sugar kinase/HSP70/actin superfamily)